MNGLENIIPLKSKITIYVPATSDVKKAIDNAPYVERVARTLSACFGGATATPAQGFWVDNGGELVKESTTMVFAYCSTDAAEKYLEDIVRLCVQLKYEMGQEAIALEYNGSMYFI